MTTLTAPLLAQIMGCTQDRAADCFDSMVKAMQAFHIDTPNRIRQFLTQVRWESGGLRYFAEIASGEAYNGRTDLGNTQPGDGPRFKGSGPIQVTGRSNFTAANKALHDSGVLPLSVDIVADPDQARTVKYGFTISCWWWEAHGGNTVADDSDQDRAAIRCGRLVNRGNANSQYKAQDESQRLDAYRRVSSFGDLSLPVPTPPPAPTPPPPSGELSMSDINDILAKLDNIDEAVHAWADGVTGKDGKPSNHVADIAAATRRTVGDFVNQGNKIYGAVVNAAKAGGTPEQIAAAVVKELSA